MKYLKPEMEIVEFNKGVLTDGIDVSNSPAGEGNGDEMDMGSMSL